MLKRATEIARKKKIPLDTFLNKALLKGFEAFCENKMSSEQVLTEHDLAVIRENIAKPTWQIMRMVRKPRSLVKKAKQEIAIQYIEENSHKNEADIVLAKKLGYCIPTIAQLRLSCGIKRSNHGRKIEEEKINWDEVEFLLTKGGLKPREFLKEKKISGTRQALEQLCVKKGIKYQAHDRTSEWYESRRQRSLTNSQSAENIISEPQLFAKG